MEKINNVKSRLVTIQDIIDGIDVYNVPRYQRLFVWKKEQINTLLFDLYDAFNSKKSSYHLGSVLLVQPDEQKKVFDLVDGQQRFTTLWLLGFEIGGSMTGFVQKQSGGTLIRFAIREDVKTYFENMLLGQEVIVDETKEKGSLGRIKDARKEIKAFLVAKFQNNPTEKDRFIDFLCNKLQLIQTQIPSKSNLSKMFEVINNRGVQLQHHDILKAQFFSKITSQSERIQYSKIWNACANIDSYIERSLALELSVGNISDCYHRWEERFVWEDVMRKCKGAESEFQKAKSIEEILKSGKIRDIEKHEIDFHPDAEDSEFQKVRSILTFPQLLLHTLRIYLLQKKKPDINKINERELLQIFKENFNEPTEQEVKIFIKLLWDIRVAFDRYVIKWVEIEPNKEILLLKKIYLQTNVKRGRTWYIRRVIEASNKGRELLQSMLYHSQQNATQYWLTPFLYRVMTIRAGDTYHYLKKLDNCLLSQDEKEDTLIQRTRKIMEVDGFENNVDFSILDQALGTSFPRYWFYKLEFVLWHELSALPDYKHWKDYRINSKNSIEHLSPQKKAFDENTVSEKLLHTFGNLGLVSRGINSELSNRPYKEKREHFWAKRNAGDIESLKLDLAFESENWGDDQCNDHFLRVIGLLKQYFDKTKN